MKDVLDLDMVLVSKNLKNRITDDGLLMVLNVALLQLAEAGRIKEAMELLKKKRS